MFHSDQISGRGGEAELRSVDKPFGVMFHHMTDHGRHPYIQGALTQPELRAFLARPNGYRILGANEWLDRYFSNTLKSDELCITFDDALRSQYDIARPVLNEFGLTAFWFVYSSVFEGNLELFEVNRYFRNTCFSSMPEFYDAFLAKALVRYPERRLAEVIRSPAATSHLDEFGFYTEQDRVFRFMRDHVLSTDEYNDVMLSLMACYGYDPASKSGDIWMKDDDLRELSADGHRIGLHSYSHPVNFRRLPVQDQISEYWRNSLHLARVLGSQPNIMAHPSNSYNDTTLMILKAIGVEVGFRSNDTLRNATALELSRLDYKLMELGSVASDGTEVGERNGVY